MSNKYELAPVGEPSLESRRKSKENIEGIDDGLTTNNEKPPTVNVEPRIGPEPANPPAAHPGLVPNPRGRRPMDVNLYATKKTVAQGMMDLALLTANANQLRYVLESGNIGPYYYFSVVLISMSIILQLLVGVVLIFIGRYNMTQDDHAEKADHLNNLVLVAIFFITAINVLISGVGVNVSDHEYLSHHQEL